MAKLPYMQFYVADFMMDVQTLDMNIRGAWITLLCLLWRTESGVIKLTVDELANLWKTDTISAQDDINSMIASNLFDHDYIAEHEQYVIKSRRIQRDRKRLNYRANWAREQRVNKMSTGHEQNIDRQIQISDTESDKDTKDLRPNKALDDFEKFWISYPRKIGKGAAKKSWIKAVKLASAQVIVDAVYQQRKGFNYEDNKKFIPLPATWLNQERWLDEAREPSPAHAASNQPKFDLEKARQIENLKQKEWDRLHPIEQLEQGDVPF